MASGPPAGVVAVACQAMATRFEIALWGSSEGHLRAAGAEALREVERLDLQLSLFRFDSDIADLNGRAAYEPVVLEPRVFRLLERAAALGALTGGAFDITVAPLMRAWGLHGGKGTVPGAQELDEARKLSGWSNLVFDAERCTVQFVRPGCAVDLGAIGKGYAVDQAVEILRECQIANALIHGGTSTAFAIGTQPDGKPWRIAIQDPRGGDEPVEVVSLSDRALSVSAPHGKQFTAADRTYGHVIDPRSGEPAQTAAFAAVVCDSATDSDALSTALLILGEPFLPVLESIGAYGLVVG